MISAAAPVSATAPAARITSGVVVPRGQRLVGGGLDDRPVHRRVGVGSPTSMMSQPPSTMARMASIEPSTDG